jgi:hypothetical protein
MVKFGGENKPAAEEDIFNNKEKSPMTFANLLKDLKDGHYVFEQVKDLHVLANGKPLDRIRFGGNGGVDFVGVEKSEKPPMTFAELLKDLKDGHYVLEQVKDLPVLVNGKSIDHISFGGNGGVDFVSKK